MWRKPALGLALALGPASPLAGSAEAGAFVSAFIATPRTAWTLRIAHSAHEAEQKQKKRTYVVLPKPENLIRYRQKLSRAPRMARFCADSG
jgi:hypothetical protein